MFDSITRHLEKTDNIARSTYIWNTVSAMMLALQGPVIQAVVSRTNGATDFGIISIAFTAATLIMYVGQYGLRRFQASDVNEQFSFEEYHGMRIVTCALLVVAAFGYCAYGKMFNGYSPLKFAVIFTVCMLKMITAYSDVFHGNMQQKGRFDVASKCTAIRYTAEILIFCVTVAITHDLLISAVVTVVSSAVMMLVLSMNACSHYCITMKPAFSTSAIKGLFIEGFPLFVGMFLNTYVSNAPRYAIDAYLTDEIQAVFSSIFMPVFVVQVAAQFIFNPLITSYAHMWNKRTKASYDAFIKRIIKMSWLVIGLAVLGLIVAATIGIPVLSAIFKFDLSGYKKELCILMLGGGPLAFSVYFNTVIAIIRAHRSLIACYGGTSLLALALAKVFVKGHGITGASWMYALLMTVLALSLLIAMLVRLRQEKRWLMSRDLVQ
ncbi:MAG: lipopolysaccharide biosynthesis protein [Mogibacterium sp.]|nr:lipopolysaccharide biosynthesis protein [Mogibacterium sp.]